VSHSLAAAERSEAALGVPSLSLSSRPGPKAVFSSSFRPEADPNWVCFSEPTARDHPHNLFKEPGLRSFLPFANWVCSAHLLCGTWSRPGPNSKHESRNPKQAPMTEIQRSQTLASHPVFRRLCHSLLEFASDFVLRISNFPAPARQIGFVLHVSAPGRATAGTTTAFAHTLQSPQVWLRFAYFPLSAAGAAGKLGSFCAFGLRCPFRRAKLGSFCTFCLRRGIPAGPNWVRFARFSPSPGPSPLGRAHSWARGRNWVRFAHFSLRQPPPARHLLQ
jgi:hypothetical protein